MRLRKNALLPCMPFFAAGRAASGVLNLLLQCSILFWPLAIYQAHRFTEQQGALLLLREFSAIYGLKSPLPPRARFVAGFAAPDAPAHATFGRAAAT